MPEEGSTTPAPHVLCIISSRRDKCCMKVQTTHPPTGQSLNIEINIIKTNYIKRYAVYVLTNG